MTPEQIAQIEAALEECANDLEAELESRYAGTKHYPSQLRKYERDMEPVKRAREALALLHSIKDEPSEGEVEAVKASIEQGTEIFGRLSSATVRAALIAARKAREE